MFVKFFFTVFAAINFLVRVSEDEDLRQLLLNGGDAARVFTLEHAADALRQLERALFHKFPIADDVDGDARIDIADQVPVKVHFAVDLDDVLAAELAARNVFEDGHRAVKLIEAEDLDVDVQVDGGINDETMETVLTAGANLLVAGSYVFNDDLAKNVKHARERMDEIIRRID